MARMFPRWRFRATFCLPEVISPCLLYTSERDPEAVALWEQETYPTLRKRAKRLGARIFFSDEAGFQSDPVLGRTYGLKGKTPVVTTSGQRQSLNVISAVNARGEFWAVTYTGKLNAESFVAFLQNFMDRQTGRIFLVVRCV